MSESCSYKDCTSGRLQDGSARVDVSAVLPSKDKLKKIKSILQVSWQRTGDAQFHPECWQALMAAARKRKQPKKGKGKAKSEANDGIELIDTEKSMLKEAAQTAERHDSEEEVKDKAAYVAELIKKSKHCVCFTGAGISTSAGIGDYRGKSGKWTMEDKARVDVDSVAEKEEQDISSPSPSKRRRFSTQESTEEDREEDGDEGVPYESLRPTYTHEALVKLMELGKLKYVISQNGDGLHGLSGVPVNKMSELHGNVFVEKCEKCNHRYDRSYYVMDDHASQYFEELEDNGETDIIKPKNAKQCDLCGLSHRTGRRCTQKGCKGFLKDSIINFRDNLEDEIYERAVENAVNSDLMLCLGTTLQVSPANELVEMGKEPLRIIICNRQKTPLDKDCDRKDTKTRKSLGCRVFGDCDVLMRLVMSHILKPAQLREWEDGRAERMQTYDTQRQ